MQHAKNNSTALHAGHWICRRCSAYVLISRLQLAALHCDRPSRLPGLRRALPSGSRYALARFCILMMQLRSPCCLPSQSTHSVVHQSSKYCFGQGSDIRLSLKSASGHTLAANAWSELLQRAKHLQDVNTNIGGFLHGYSIAPPRTARNDPDSEFDTRTPSACGVSS